MVLNGTFSDWMEVISGTPQGSILGPLLFIIYINDIDDNITIDILKKFADDTKGGQTVSTIADQEKLQTALNQLYSWSKKWGMEFNVSKCKILHVGKNNPNFDYYLASEKLQVVESEKDIGVKIHSSMKPFFNVMKLHKELTLFSNKLQNVFTIVIKKSF